MDWLQDNEYYGAYRYSFDVDGDLAGYSKSTTVFTELLLRNVGHLAMKDNPKAVYTAFDMFLQEQRFDDDSKFKKIKKDKRIMSTKL